MELTTRQCPSCKALPGEPCITTKRTLMATLHPTRRHTTDPLTGRVCRRTASGTIDVHVGTGYPIGRAAWIGRHRVVLFEALQMPTESSCHRCGWMLPWRLNNSSLTGKDLSSRQVLVEHRDGSRDNDIVTNLAIVCCSCGEQRFYTDGIPQRWFEQFRRDFAAVPPWERPSAIEWLAQVGVLTTPDELCVWHPALAQVAPSPHQ